MAARGDGNGRAPKRGKSRSNRDLPPALTHGIDASTETALGHRTRREILRALANGTDALSPSQLVQDGAVDASVAAVSYHAKVLVKTDSIVIADENWSRGSTQCFYRSVVRDDPQVKRILKAMASADRSVGPPA